jgi:hypothetical protein
MILTGSIHRKLYRELIAQLDRQGQEPHSEKIKAIYRAWYGLGEEEDIDVDHLYDWADATYENPLFMKNTLDAR